ncbi:MAG: GspE/PulE family protein [Janthinobacterium lividum]
MSATVPATAPTTTSATIALPIRQLSVETLRKSHWRLEADLVLPGYEDQSLVLVSRATMRYLLLIDEQAFQRIGPSDLLDRFDSALRSRRKLRREGVYIGDMETLLLTHSRLQQDAVVATKVTEQRTGAHRNFNLLLETALELGASDIHLEFREGKDVAVRLRVHGKMRSGRETSPLFADYVAMLDAVTAAYNSRADFSSRSHNHFDEHQHQSCSVPVTIRGRQYQLRFQSVRENRGLDVVLRILLNEARDTDVMTLAELGYAPDQIDILENAVLRSPGLLIIAGETGSGKSTTLRTLMGYERAAGKKFYSIEDPVEYIQPHVTQIPIQRRAEAGGESAFGAAARVVLRGDPDKIMPGEIRDRETCGFAKAMTETGHQVLSTVHASSCFGILQRLTSDELGMPLHAIAAPRFLVALVYQKLLPELCDRCRRPARDHLDDARCAILRELGFALQRVQVAGPGCSHCKYLGTQRQTVAAEVCEIDEAMLPLIAERRFWDLEKRWRTLADACLDSPRMRGKTAMEHALYKMSIGRVDPCDVEAAFYPLRKLMEERRAGSAAPALRGAS